MKVAPRQFSVLNLAIRPREVVSAVRACVVAAAEESAGTAIEMMKYCAKRGVLDETEAKAIITRYSNHS